MKHEYKRKFYVGFMQSAGWRWWKIFTGKKRQHIYLITPCGNRSCVIIDFSEGGTALYYYNRSAITLANKFRSKGEEVIEYEAVQSEMEKRSIKLIRSCVAVAKDFLGISNPFIITPNQLYNYLTRRK